MVKQQNSLEQLNRYFPQVACAIALLLLSVQPAFSATKPDGTMEITDGKEQFMGTLASMPYTSNGAGPVLYVLECSTCPSSQAFEKDWKGQLDGVELRRLLIASSAATANETAYLARTRDINDFYAFMNHTKVAPPIKACNCPDDNKAVQAFNSVINPFGKVLKPTMVKNGWPKGAPAPPQFMWETNGHVYVGAYSKKSFPDILSMLRSGNQTVQVIAPPSHTPAPVPTSKESSAIETTGQLVTAEKNSPKPADAAPANNSGSTAVGSGGTGPDVLGLRIGMTPDQVRAIFKSRVLLSNGLRSSYKELNQVLMFKDPNTGSNVRLQNGLYLSKVEADGIQDDLTNHKITVLFSPVPGQEGIVSIDREVRLAPGKRPIYDAFEKTLVEKYGTPTLVDPGKGKSFRIFSWSYDNNGSLKEPGSIKDYHPCLEGLLPLGFPGKNTLPQLEKVLPQCGGIFLNIQVNINSVAPGPETLVTDYLVWMRGFDAATRAAKATNAIKDKASADVKALSIKNGQQQKPVL